MNLLGGKNELFAPILFCMVVVLSAQILSNLSGRKLGLADVTEISGQVNGLACK